jgi:MYXO-CTERM domain-containing protein
MVASGALCLGFGTAQAPQLNVGALGLFVPSLAELGTPAGNDALLLVTRPLKPLGFTIGDGTTESPALTMHIQDFEIDFYAFLFERYTRAFTMRISMDLGMNLDFTTDENGAPAVLPILTGLEPGNVELVVLNEEFLREDAAALEEILPSILDFAIQALDDNLQPIALPEFAGFSLSTVATQKVRTSEDEFLAITAELGPGTLMASLAGRYPSVAARLRHEAAAQIPTLASHDVARLVAVDTPTPRVVLDALGGRGGRLPQVHLDLANADALGRPLEWTWSIGGGLWRPFVRGGQVTLTDPAFAIQGKYDLLVRARVVGDYRTLDRTATVLPLVIDSAPPRILGDELASDDGHLLVRAVDLVSSADEVEIALGAPGAVAPATGWSHGRFALTTARRLAGPGNELTIFARDALGNQAVVELEVPEPIFKAKPASEGGCAAGGGATAGWLAGFLGLGWLFGRRRRRPTGLLALAAVALLPFAAGCGSDEGTCEQTEDCTASCAAGEVPLCLDGTCVCQAEIQYGSIGQYSELAVTNGGTAYVSAYNRTHGDLMVARVDHDGRILDEEWTYVAGVPDGPVVFDADSASLMLASDASGEWKIHTVDQGIPGTEDQAWEIAGRFSTLTLDADDRPGIAYFVEMQDTDGNGATTQLRFAQANTAAPNSSADWTIYTVDQAVVPPDAGFDPLTIPMGTGLFAAADRLGDDRPVIAYYDRINGDLKLATASAGGGGFDTPELIDGAEGVDVGWYPGIFVDTASTVHLTYVDVTNNDLLYVNTAEHEIELIDDGYRIVGQTPDGLPKPEWHYLGDDSAIVLTSAGPYAAYQDATTHELLVANKGADGSWRHKVLAGDETPFEGGYGFYASAILDLDSLMLSTWVIDQPNSQSWVELIRATPVPIE